MGRSELFRHRGTATRGLEGLFGAGAGMAEYEGRELREYINAEKIGTWEVGGSGSEETRGGKVDAKWFS